MKRYGNDLLRAANEAAINEERIAAWRARKSQAQGNGNVVKFPGRKRQYMPHPPGPGPDAA